MVRWTDDDLTPTARGPRNTLELLVAELSTQPGRWAEVARYTLERKGSASSRGAQSVKRYPELQYVVRREGDEFVLYMRKEA